MFYCKQLRSPIAIVWEITNACNYRCPHCRAYMDVTKQEEKIETRIIDEIIKNDILSVNISGGEPLLNPRILNIISKLAASGIDVGISSNGWMYPKMAESLKDSGQSFIQISVDGPKSIHDEFRGVNGAFERAIQSLKIAKELNLRTQMNVTITSKNINTLESNIEIALQLGIDRIFYRRVVPTGKGKDNLHLLPNKKKYLQAIQNINSIKLDGIDIVIDDPVVSIINKSKSIEKNIIGCTAGIKSLGIDSNANVYPCIFLRENIGNLMNNTLNEIWTKSDIINNLRKRNIGVCGECEFNYICGGCRAYSGIYNKDEMCPR